MKGPLSESELLCCGKVNSLAKITNLDLSRRGITQIDTKLFNQLTKLQSLDLSLNNITSIPDDLNLPSLKVLDVSDNQLTSVEFIEKLTKLEKLYIEDNDGLSMDDYYISKCLCPLLSSIDGGEDVKHIENGIVLYQTRLEPQIQAVWEAKFSEVYSEGVNKEEVKRLHQEFVDTINKAEIVGSSLTLNKFRKFMIDKLCIEIIAKVNSRKTITSTRSCKDTPTRYGTRVAKGITPVKNYSMGVPIAAEEMEMSKSSCNTKKRKRDDMEDGSPIKSPVAKRKKENFGTPDFVKVTKKEDMPKDSKRPVSDYNPVLFVRCHSVDNDPADNTTKVWQCAFEPSIDQPGETTNILATCGGKCICFIDCLTGKLMKRYKTYSKNESFYSLAWTTLKADSKVLKEDMNILAVGGHDCVIRLIHPTQLVVFGTLRGHRGYISSLVFHPSKPNILCSGSKDSKIIMWEIGNPDFKDNSITWSQKAIFTLPGTDAITLVINDQLNLLIAGCESSCYAWNLDKLEKKKNTTFSEDYEFVHPLLDDNDEEAVVDGLALLSNNCIVSKCVDHDRLYVWDIKQHIATRTRSSGLHRVQLSPFVLLDYKPTAVDYLFLNVTKDILSAGDDKGNVYMYNLKSVVKNKKMSLDQLLQPSRVLEYPNLILDNQFCDKMEDVLNKKDVVVNCVQLSSSGEHLVCGTDNNLICIWKQQW
ncbi:hypothetical protein ACF0H5_016962 [Mactra antiquata]